MDTIKTFNKLIGKSKMKQNPTNMPSLNQGNNFNKYQNKLKSQSNQINKHYTEGFSNPNNTSMSKSGQSDFSQSQYSDNESLNTLKTEYNNTLEEYKKLLEEVSTITTDYVKRLDTNNPYLNKFVRFSTGQICYVTNQGIVKYIPDIDAIDSTGLKYDDTYIEIDIPFNDEWTTNPGSTIPTNPPLISGTNIDGSQIGNEGENVFVNNVINNQNADYSGCYANNDNDPMIFIGGAPTSNRQTDSIINGNFDNPEIPANSFEYISSESRVPGWFFNAVLINNSNTYGYPKPYPNGNQAVSIQDNQSITQSLNIDAGTYTLSLFACGRNCCDNSGEANTINIKLNESIFYTINPPINSWQYFSVPVTITTSGSNTIQIVGTSTTNRSTAIQNIQISAPRSGTYTYDTCKQEAINGGFKYFALQNVDPVLSSGYCGVSNSYASSTATPSSNCKLMNDGNNGGLQGTNALYEMQEVGVPSNLGKYAYINEDSKLYSYPNNVFQPPNGVPNTYAEIDSLTYQNYNYGGSIQSEYGMTKTTSVKKQQLSQVESKLNQLSSKINSLTNKFQKNGASMDKTIFKNTKNANDYLYQIDNNKKSIENANMNSDNINNILDDSDIVVLQKNYQYMFFAILAAGTILISINVLRKQ